MTRKWAYSSFSCTGSNRYLPVASTRSMAWFSLNNWGASAVAEKATSTAARIVKNLFMVVKVLLFTVYWNTFRSEMVMLPP